MAALTPKERNAVIDECVALVRAYRSDQHARARLRQKIARTARRIPDTPQGMIILGLQSLKAPEPIPVKCEVVGTSAIVYSPSEEKNVNKT